MTPAELDRLRVGARGLVGHELSERALNQFSKYLELLQKWQRRSRLIGSVEPTWVVENLFLDSLLFLQVLPHTTTTLLDIGSGAGLPGYPLKIAHPALRLTLVESRQIRATFLKAVARELELDGVTVVTDRAEHVAGLLESSFDAAVMRCAGGGDELLTIAARFIRRSGIVVASGPPNRRPLPLGDWIEVPGVKPASRRLFAVYRRP